MPYFNYRMILFPVLALILGITVRAAQNNSRPLTNDDIIRMVQEKVDEDIILRAINTSEIYFDISPSGLIQLKKGKVKKHIIEAIQSAQLSKNNSRTSSGNSSEQLPRFGELPESTSTPAPSPTPKPTPVATQYAEFFKFDLERCSISGTTVICYFKITNTAQDRLLQHMACMSCYPGGSELVDDVGGTTRIRDYNIGSSGSGTPSYEANILTNAFTKAWFKFDGVSSEAQKIGRLTLALVARPGGGFTVQFRDIPLTKPR